MKFVEQKMVFYFLVVCVFCFLSFDFLLWRMIHFDDYIFFWRPIRYTPCTLEVHGVKVTFFVWWVYVVAVPLGVQTSPQEAVWKPRGRETICGVLLETLTINKWLKNLQTEIATSSQLFEISGMIFAALCGLIYVIHLLIQNILPTSAFLPAKIVPNNPTRQLWLVQLSFWCYLLCHLAGETWLKQHDLILAQNAKKKTQQG